MAMDAGLSGFASGNWKEVGRHVSTLYFVFVRVVFVQNHRG